MRSPTSPVGSAVAEEEEMPPTITEGEEEMPPTIAEEEEEMPSLKRKSSAVAEEGKDMPPTIAEDEEDMRPWKKIREEEAHEDDGGGSQILDLLFGPLPDPDSPSAAAATAPDHDSDYDTEDFTKEGLEARDAVLSVSKSVVSLAAYVDGDTKPTFSCTGTVVYHDGSATWIITSAALIRKHGSETEVQEASIMKYNIAIVSIKLEANLPAVELSDLPDSYFLTPTPVVAIARKFESKSLQMRCGKTFRGASKLDCNELMISTCQIEQTFIGGLLMDLDKRIVGMNFMDEETAPFLPVEVVGRCLKHFKMFQEIKQPWLGIRGRALNLLELNKLEEIFLGYPKPCSGILVDMISEASCANCEGVEVGDILNQLDGVVLHSPGQLTGILLDKMEFAIQTQKPVVLKAVLHRPKDGTKFTVDFKVRGRSPGERDVLFENRWTRPKPELNWCGAKELMNGWVPSSF